LGWGFLGLCIIPIAVLILFFTLIGYPIAILGIYVYTVLFFLSSIFVSLVVGEKILQLFFKKPEGISLYLSFILGTIILLVLGVIPFLGILVKLGVLLFGSGMLLIGIRTCMREARQNQLI
jgi:hypothetical protein